MKTYIEMEQKQKEYQAKYDTLKVENSNDKLNLSIYADWVDLLDEFLIWNVVKYAEKVGYDFESDEEIFDFTDAVKKEIVIKEEEVKERFERLERELHSKMAEKRSQRRNLLLQNEYDVLKWMLE